MLAALASAAAQLWLPAAKRLPAAPHITTSPPRACRSAFLRSKQRARGLPASWLPHTFTAHPTSGKCVSMQLAQQCAALSGAPTAQQSQLQRQRSNLRTQTCGRRRALRCSASASGVSVLKETDANVTFGFDLLGMGKITEQARSSLLPPAACTRTQSSDVRPSHVAPSRRRRQGRVHSAPTTSSRCLRSERGCGRRRADTVAHRWDRIDLPASEAPYGCCV